MKNLNRIRELRQESTVYHRQHRGLWKVAYALAFIVFLLHISIKLNDLHTVPAMAETGVALSLVIFVLVTIGSILLVVSRFELNVHCWDFGMITDFVILGTTSLVMLITGVFVGAEHFAYNSLMTTPNIDLIETSTKVMYALSQAFRYVWYALGLWIVVKTTIGYLTMSSKKKENVDSLELYHKITKIHGGAYKFNWEMRIDAITLIISKMM